MMRLGDWTWRNRERGAGSPLASRAIQIFQSPSPLICPLYSTQFFIPCFLQVHILFSISFQVPQVSILYHSASNFKFHFLLHNIYHPKYNFAQFSIIIHYWCPSLGSINTVSHSVKMLKTMISKTTLFFHYFFLVLWLCSYCSFPHTCPLPSFLFLSLPLKFFFFRTSPLLLWCCWLLILFHFFVNSLSCFHLCELGIIYQDIGDLSVATLLKKMSPPIPVPSEGPATLHVTNACEGTIYPTGKPQPPWQP